MGNFLFNSKPEHDPEFWKEKFKNESVADRDAAIFLYKSYRDFPKYAPTYAAILKALEDNEPYQTEKRERKRLKELNKERQLEWDRETGCTKRMNELGNYLKLHPGEPLPYTMKDIIRECKAIKPRPVDLIYPGDELSTLEDWRKEIGQYE